MRFWVALVLLWLVALPGYAQQALVAPRWLRSVEVTRPGTTVRAWPTTESARRGTVQVGTRLPFVARVRGHGCPGGEWIQIGAEAFVCETLVRYSPSPPEGDPLPRLDDGALTPRSYAFVRTDGTWAYGRPEDIHQDQWVETLGDGFGVAIVETTVTRGIEMARTLSGLWVPVSELRFARPSDFVGVAIEPETELGSLGWIVRERAAIRDRPGGRVVERGSRLMAITVAGRQGDWVELGDGRFVHHRDVAQPRPTTVPTEVPDGARWVDVDTRTQTVVAYVGARPVYATLVSTGRPETPTPAGIHRVWVKLAEDDMDDLERDDVSENYAIQAVPWVQYFEGSNGFHAAFWHDRFGQPHSHGCVNLAPRDARWLFEFTEPRVPPGWDAILPTEHEPGTIVQVR